MRYNVGMRKFIVVIIGILYLPLLLLVPNVIALNHTVGSQTFVQQTVQEAGLYSAAANQVIGEVSKSSDISTSPLAQEALKRTLTGEALQKLAEPFINQVYQQLNQAKPTVTAQVSLQALQAEFTKQFEQLARERLATLPSCGRSAPRNIDPLTVSCLPAGANIESLITQAKLPIEQQAQQALPADKTISLDKEQPAAGDTSNSPDGQQIRQNLEHVGRIYRITKASEPFLIGAAILFTAGLLALSRPWTKGFKRVGILSLIAAGCLFITTIAMSTLNVLLAGTFIVTAPDAAPARGTELAKAVERAVELLINQASSIQRLFCIIYVSLGLAAIITYLFVRKKGAVEPKKPVQHIEEDNLLADDNKDLDEPAPYIEEQDKPASTKKKTNEPKVKP